MTTYNSDGIPIHQNKINVGSANGVAAYADSSPAPIADPDGKTGWYFAKTGGTEKFNYYFYSEGSHPITVQNLQDVFFVGSVNHWDSATSAPFVVVYTKPTGVGDAGAWFHSKRAFTITTLDNIVLGKKTQFSTHPIPSPKFPYQHIQLSNIVTSGDYADAEEILTISVQSDSGAHDDTSILISHVGWKGIMNGVVVNPNIILKA